VWILACTIAITLIAWADLVRRARRMSTSIGYEQAMAAMGMSTVSPWDIGDAWLTFGMWTVMMVGMMAASVAPVLLLYAGAQSRRDDAGARFAVLLFGCGYAAVWIGFSAVAAAAQWVLHNTALLSPDMRAIGPQPAGLILTVAGVYQATPWKGACLTYCRSPLAFLMTNWRDGRFGPFIMGLRHGLHCVGCCWALMCVLFAVGVMNLLWVAALTMVIFLEKVGPGGAIVGRAAGIVLVAVGVVFLAR
jgi:predicted metal-binding membrane protein